MTASVVRTLGASSAHLFDTLPDPLGFHETHRLTRHRPDWKRVALRDGRVVARAAWWGGPKDTRPLLIDWFDVAEGEEEAGADLLRTAPWPAAELEIDVPAARRGTPAVRAAVATRAEAARRAGYAPLVERFLYRWTPDRGLPARPGRLVFRTEADDGVFFDALRRIHSVTLDAHARRAVALGGADRAAQEGLDFLRWLPSPRAWWQVARTPGGATAGIHIPAHNPSGPCVAFIGVLPEHRGHGYAYDLLAECTHFLAERGAPAIGGATDQGNFPMAAHFAEAGYPVVRERLVYAVTPG
ncbi:GNAT family N-acetyltransferase [Streptomyces sp. TG1A-8]|uniref:GNAT family N-acetyltransferase n=1 Tax=Streptomyces sp. TG1A-8 TaxID=3051385 RepID=UPI00265B9F36|nr:GNAT family N-acetyltransferase [Streptomyces sp. TG1A-8]MDO0929214.1 GNAT family N-acetyltransferase [Streptomyces sp. TG1A-8]